MKARDNAEPHQRSSLITANTPNMPLAIVLDRCLNVQHEPRIVQLDKSQKSEAKDPGPASSPLTSLPTQCSATFNDGLVEPESAAATALPADLKMQWSWRLTRPGIALFQKKSYKVYMCAVITSNMFRPMESVTDTGAGLNLVCISLLSDKWRHHIHNMSFMPVSNTAVSFIGKAMVFFHLGHLHQRVRLSAVDSLTVQVLIGKSFINSFIKVIIPLNDALSPSRLN